MAASHSGMVLACLCVHARINHTTGFSFIFKQDFFYTPEEKKEKNFSSLIYSSHKPPPVFPTLALLLLLHSHHTREASKNTSKELETSV